MQKFAAVVLLVLAFIPGPGRAALALVEGQDYESLPVAQPVETGKKIEVREFFWYGCPHCYVLEPGLERWVKKLPASVWFVRTPGTAPHWLTHAQAYYTFDALGVAKSTHNAFFKAVQEQKQQLNDANAIGDFMATRGIDKQKFMESFNSFGVRTNLEKARQLNKDYNVSSVPALVIDGKYLTSPGMVKDEDRFFKVVDELIARAARERKQKAKKL